MMSIRFKKIFFLSLLALGCFALGTSAFAAASGIGAVASNVTGNLDRVAKLITAGSYVAGFGFAVAAIVKFKAHKDNPTQITISQPIVLLFVAAALIYIPSVFKTAGGTMGLSGKSSVTGVTSFS